MAEQTQKELKKYNYNAIIVNIENKSIANDHNEAELIGFIIPIYAFGLPEMAVNFLNKLPKSKKQKTFLFTSPAGHEGVGILQGSLILKSKGYNLVKAHSVYMPDTWIAVMNAPEDEKLQKKCSDNSKILGNYLKEIEEGKTSIGIANPLAIISLGLIYLMFVLIGRHQAGKVFCFNKKCVKCKICYENCPSKTIKWKNKRPYWSWNCQQCFRCINACPYNAIEISNIALVFPFVVSIASMYCYKFLPYIAKLNFINPIPEIIFVSLMSLSACWLVQILHNYKLLPPLYLTKTRKRYSFFRKKLINK